PDLILNPISGLHYSSQVTPSMPTASRVPTKNVKHSQGGLMRTSLGRLAFLAAALGSFILGSAQAQEVKGGATTAGAPMSPSLVPVTQAMLDSASSDGVNHMHPNSNYEQ